MAKHDLLAVVFINLLDESPHSVTRPLWGAQSKSYPYRLKLLQSVAKVSFHQMRSSKDSVDSGNVTSMSSLHNHHQRLIKNTRGAIIKNGQMVIIPVAVVVVVETNKFRD